MINKLNPCTCIGWEKSMQQIEGTQFMAFNHGVKYTGKQMLYCPWCGKKRTEQSVNDDARPEPIEHSYMIHDA